MSTKVASVAAVAAPLVAEAAARGLRPPVCLEGVDARAWIVVRRGPDSRARDALVLDEFGDLWWARLDPRGYTARVTRGLWPEEGPAFVDSIRDSMGAMLDAATRRAGP